MYLWHVKKIWVYDVVVTWIHCAILIDCVLRRGHSFVFYSYKEGKKAIQNNNQSQGRASC